MDFDISLNFNDGEHHSFHLELDDSFFALKENSLLDSGKLSAELGLSRQEDTLDLKVKLSGKIFSQCDRCLKDISLPVDAEFSHYLKFTTDEDLLEDENHIPADSLSYSVYDLLYEGVCLNAPQRHLCEFSDKAEACEMVSFDQKNENTDPRWDQLKKLID